MFINIDIQIENDNGQPIHRFQKQFDCKETGIVPYENQSFDYFLAQVLSYSGRTVRSVLLSEEKASFSSQSELQIKEVEYTVRLNSGNSFGGVIPFYPVSASKEAAGECWIKKEDLGGEAQEDKIRQNVLPFPVQKRRLNIRSAVQMIMEHAVVQYEAQFLQISNQEIHFMENS